MNDRDAERTADQSTNELEAEIEEYLREKERLRPILGRIGGVPRKKQKILNWSFLILVVACFSVALFVQDPRNLPLEVAILLVSVKLILVLGQIAKMNHFQFWMLSTMEWRLNQLARNFADSKGRGSTGDSHNA